MRSPLPLLALSCLVVGTLGALGYSHYLGEGKQLADLQEHLGSVKTSLEKVTQENLQAKREADVMSAQIQQLAATKEELKKQLNELKNSSPEAAAPPASNPMVGMVKVQMARMNDAKFLLLKSRLQLTPEQETAVKTAVDQESQRAEDMTTKMFSGGKVDTNGVKNAKSLDQTLNDILTPDQKMAYQQMKADEKNSAAEMVATVEMNQVSPLLQLNETQKDQVYSALAQVQLDTRDSAWMKAHVPNSSTNPFAILDAQAKAKEEALAKILTPQQLATYRQQAQSQLDTQKSMMQKFMPPSATTAPVATPAPAAAP